MGLILGAIGVIMTAAVTVSKALAVVGLAIQGLKVIGNAIASIAKALGIIKPERDIEEIGDRAFQAEEKGITPDKYSSYEAWVKDIEREDWGYDPEKNKDMDLEKKVLKGVEVSIAITIERFPELPIQEFFSLAGKNPEFFTIERMDEIGKLASNDSDAFGKVVNYITNSAKDHTTVDAASDILMDIEQIIEPGISENVAYDKVAGYKGMK
jgi:hypothetical protein